MSSPRTGAIDRAGVSLIRPDSYEFGEVSSDNSNKLKLSRLEIDRALLRQDKYYKEKEFCSLFVGIFYGAAFSVIGWAAIIWAWLRLS